MILTPQLAHPQVPQLPEHLQVEQSQGDILVVMRISWSSQGVWWI